MMFIGLLIVVFIFFNFYKDKNVYTSSDRSPVIRLKERFIKGEIDEDTYLRMLDVLRLEVK